MKKLLEKYYSLKKQCWTHILIPYTYFFWLSYIGLGIYTLPYHGDDGGLGAIIAILMIGYLWLCAIVFFITIVSYFIKKNLVFLTKNKIYNVIWNIGNILSVLFILIIIGTAIIISLPI